MNEYTIIILLALAGAGVYAAFRYGRHIERIIAHTKDQDARIAELEAIISRKRHTHATQEVLEAVLFTVSRMLIERDQEDLWLNRIREQLGDILRNPNGYPKE